MSRSAEDLTTQAFNRLNIHDSQKPTNEDTDSKDVSASKEATLIKFARFVNGTLELLEARPDKLEYVAFSHVWGDWEWRKVPGVPYEVKVSQEKADFIENDLPALVGDCAFWMDTLTVDQCKEKEVLAIVQSIPTIFRMAKRTIAVRESDGLYDCCMKAVEGFQDYSEFCKKLNKHGGEHDDYVYNESYLQRLWTLQECLLSHTIQFVVSHSSISAKEQKGKERDGDLNFYKSQIEETVIADSLWVLAYSFKGIEGVPGISEFLKAYVHGGTVINPKSPLRTEEEDIYTGNFLRVNLASHRSATMPRDYIFATMPQFPWYKYPKEAIGMSFGEIYMDMYQQAADSDHAFTCQFTRSMLEPEATDPVEAWLPSKHQPIPSCLGDFLKLVGHRVPKVSNGMSPHVHLTTVIKVQEFCCHPWPNWVLATLESSMGLFQQQWSESHRGGELSKLGNFPSTDWNLDHVDAMRCGWQNKDPEWKLHVLEDGDNTVINYGPGLEYAEDDLLQNLYTLDEDDADGREIKENYVSLFEQTRRILDHMWCSEDPLQKNESQKSDWLVFKNEMRAAWSTPLLRTMLLFAAMITCRIPLSAIAWVNRLFVPVYVQYGESLMTLGLLAKHARQEEADRDQPRQMCSVGQHLPDQSGATRGSQFGKDHFLVDLNTKVPVGILPDFLPDDRTDKQYTQITNVLYSGLCQVLEHNKVGIITVPLGALQESSPSS